MRSLSPISLLCLTLLLGGCRPDQETSFIEKSLHNKPIVGINPVIDHARHGLSWDLSQELTAAIRLRLTQQDRLYLLDETQTKAKTQKHNPFEENVDWLKKSYPQNEFAAFLELIEHRENPTSTAENAPVELSIVMRVHVFDLREDKPKAVLQEVFEQSHHIPSQFTKAQNNQVTWGSDTFEISPLGLAHNQLCQEIATRIEDYILLNCDGK